jgi:hypothetical protein
MSTYQFFTSNILTGQIMADTLPIVGQTASRQINQIGNFNGYLPLVDAAGQDASTAMVTYWRNSLIPWKSILWILQDGHPIWGGPVVGWPHQSITDGTLPIQAATMENLFKYRQLTKQLSYANVDVFDIFKAELEYALSKKPNGNVSGTGRYTGSAGLQDNVAKSGQLGSITETAGFQSIYDCWNDLVTSYGLEYTLTPSIADAKSFYFNVILGLPMIGRTYGTTRLRMQLPGLGSVDYAWQWVPSNPVNRMVVTGSGTAVVNTGVNKTKVNPGKTVARNYTAIATASNELSQGYPLLEGNTSFFGTITSQAQANNYAKNLLYSSTIIKSLTPLWTVGGDAIPMIRETQLGDEVFVTATSPLHPATAVGGPGLEQLMRITGWTLTFPNAQTAESTQFQLGDVLTGSL